MSKYGLRKKPTYNSLIEYIQNDQPNIKYPNRLATQIMNSRELSKLDGLGMIGIEEQQLNLGVERQRQNQISEIATREGTTAKHIRSIKPPGKKLSEPIFFDIGTDSNAESFMDDIEEIINEEDAKKTAKATGVMSQVISSLVNLVPSQQDFAHRMASVASSSTSLIPSAASITSMLNNAIQPATTDLISGGTRAINPYIDPAKVDVLNPFAMPKAKARPLALRDQVIPGAASKSKAAPSIPGARSKSKAAPSIPGAASKSKAAPGPRNVSHRGPG